MSGSPRAVEAATQHQRHGRRRGSQTETPWTWFQASGRSREPQGGGGRGAGRRGRLVGNSRVCVQQTREAEHTLVSALCPITRVCGLGHVRLSAAPRIAAHQAPLPMGVLQARIVEWAAMPFSRGSSRLRDEPRLPQSRQILYGLSPHGSPHGPRKTGMKQFHRRLVRFPASPRGLARAGLLIRVHSSKAALLTNAKTPTRAAFCKCASCPWAIAWVPSTPRFLPHCVSLGDPGSAEIPRRGSLGRHCAEPRAPRPDVLSLCRAGTWKLIDM